MSEGIKCPDQFVFGLDIGTRSLVGTIGYMDSYGFHVVAMEVIEHTTRAMMDGQIHDINVVAEEIKTIKTKLEDKINRKLSSVCIAAAGRVLRTITVSTTMPMDSEVKITNEDIYSLELAAVDLAHRKLTEEDSKENYYCVGYTPVKYFLNDYEISNLEGHKGTNIGVNLLATFLPEEVVDGLYSAVEMAGLEVANLTLEPIAAMNVAIPSHYRLLNIALVDVGAGTSDICITKEGSIIAYGMIPCAGDEISETIAKHYLVDFATAEKIKLGAGKKKKVSFKDIMGTKLSVMPEEINELAKDVVTKIAVDVADKIKELNGGRAVSAVFIVGGGGKIPGFASLLAKELSLPEARVALRGKEVLEDVEFAIDNLKKDSLYVTPIGICINYYNQKNNFISVTVNGDKIKLYDNNKLTVIDAVMQAGYPNEKLFPRRGPSVNYTLNGVARMVRGESGEPAKIFKNGKETTLNAEIMKNDFIDIEESTVGKEVSMRLDELIEFNSSVSFVVNGMNITCPRYAYVNGNIETGTYIIRDGDVITMEDFYSVKQLFAFMDITVDDKIITVNNAKADENTKVYANFNVQYTESYLYSGNDYEETAEDTVVKKQETVETPVEASPEVVTPVPVTTGTSVMRVTVNGTLVELKGKNAYIFVDILDVYPFDMSKMGGSKLIMQVDGNTAEFTTPLYDGATISLYWQ